MKYITGYLWQGAEACPKMQLNEKECVLLQQILCGKTEVILACVSDGAELGSYLTGQLKGWLQKHVRELTGDKRKRGDARRMLEAVQKQIHRELDSYLQSKGRQENENGNGNGSYTWQDSMADPEINFSAILIVGQDFWLLQGGKCECYFFNRRFQRTHCRRLGSEYCESWQVTEGSLEKGVGILLASESFFHSVTQDNWKECLAAQDITREEQIERRLKELAKESVRQGYKGTYAAVYIRSV